MSLPSDISEEMFFDRLVSPLTRGPVRPLARPSVSPSVRRAVRTFRAACPYLCHQIFL